MKNSLNKLLVRYDTLLKRNEQLKREAIATNAVIKEKSLEV